MSYSQYPSCLGFRSWVKRNRTSRWLLWAMGMYMTSVFHGKSCIPGTWIHTWLGFESMMEWNWISSQTFGFFWKPRQTEKSRSCTALQFLLQPGFLGPQLYDASQRSGWSNQWPGLWSNICPAVWKQPFVLLNNSRHFRSLQHSPFLLSVHMFSHWNKSLEHSF